MNAHTQFVSQCSKHSTPNNDNSNLISRRKAILTTTSLVSPLVLSHKPANAAIDPVSVAGYLIGWLIGSGISALTIAAFTQWVQQLQWKRRTEYRPFEYEPGVEVAPESQAQRRSLGDGCVIGCDPESRELMLARPLPHGKLQKLEVVSPGELALFGNDFVPVGPRVFPSGNVARHHVSVEGYLQHPISTIRYARALSDRKRNPLLLISVIDKQRSGEILLITDSQKGSGNLVKVARSPDWSTVGAPWLKT
jgi:hypothetical protein